MAAMKIEARPDLLVKRNTTSGLAATTCGEVSWLDI
jgi:hypothetical protein